MESAACSRGNPQMDKELDMVPTKAKAISIDGINYIAEASLNS
jgi:hypothetical protein